MDYEVRTVRELLDKAAEKYGTKDAFMYFEKKEQKGVSFEEFRQKVIAFGEWMSAEGCLDKRIAILGENSFQYVLSCFTIMAGGGVAVPIDRELSCEQALFLVRDSGAGVLICADDYMDVGEAIAASVTDLKTINMKEIPFCIEKGRTLIEEGKDAYSNARPEANSLAMILYTSGTTGRSKGVMLTQLNMMSQLKVFDVLAFDDKTHRTLLILPLHHAFGIVVSVYCVFWYGATNYIARSLRKLKEDILISRPDVILAVPMILKFLMDTMMKEIDEKGKRKKFEKAVKISEFLRIFRIDRRRELFHELHDALGGELKYFVVGGAPIDQLLIDEYEKIGITVLNGYGISECSPVVSVNSRIGPVKNSAGRIIPINEVRIGDGGEILVRGDGVMQGYWHMEKETEDVFRDGWFHTGDIGEMDDGMNLFITGRIKNLIILANGENVAAEPLEELIYRIPFVKEVVVYGENGKITAEIYPDPDVKDAGDRVREEIDAINKSLPSSRTITGIKLRDVEFPKTSTKKIKRNISI